ncbi:hypothetical protein FRB94_011328 [Tulasnella sp. JGI-2019a]|nr:hypothetical protein FRB93_009332 [Tulasnella sp. JGI-2019a]KAG9009882.1 hypothetical protein FRB94_011328 [Tulasnella sp. JGI-2019a]
MATPGQNGAAAVQRQPAVARAEQPKSDTTGQIWRLVQQLILAFMVSTVIQKFLNNNAAPKTPQPVVPAVPTTGDAQPAGDAGPPVTLAPMWPIGSIFDMHGVVSTAAYDPYSPRLAEVDKGLPRFSWPGIRYGDWADERAEDFMVDIPNSVQHNASLWLHIFLTLDGTSPNQYTKNFNPERIHYHRKALTRYHKRPRIVVEKHLIGGDKEEEEKVAQAAAEEKDVWLSYWHPNVTLTLVSDAGSVPLQQLSGPTGRYYNVHESKRDATGKTGFYYPIIFPNDFWLLRGHMNPINTTTPTLPLHVSYHAISNMKFQLYATFSIGFEEASNKGGGATSADLDEIKRTLVETNPWLLITTAVVSVLHMVFEMLAFTSDVSHWRTRKELVGVSVRTILVNVFVQIITTLYLWDNAEETSWMILFTQVVGVAIEAWKITKAVDIEVAPAGPGSFFPYRLIITDKHVLNEEEKKTQVFDQLAFRYVSYVTIPLLAAYTVYSLMYESHKGWYSFILTTLTSFVYMFGFVQLVPQLIINYKLKSVAHMPWKAMVYKTLSTVVDDFFAFVIKMPWLHRLACFRDDVVFLILLYQRWIYRIDPKRANEYGQVGEAELEKEKVADKQKVVAGTDKKE